MKKINITKREILFFFFGFLTMFLIVLIFEWSDFKSGLIDGWNSPKIEIKK